MVTVVIFDAIDDSAIEFSYESIPLILQDMLESFLDHLILVLCSHWFGGKRALMSELRETKLKEGDRLKRRTRKLDDVNPKLSLPRGSSPVSGK